ncbi:MAG: tetratricopeptide repeat protein [Brumimicrobium sp.]|nr:tetratricopeptide repeat protein [Brumimicrobium sp.]
MKIHSSLFLTAILCFCLTADSLAQENRADSLRKVLSKNPAKKKLPKIYFELGETFFMRDNDSAVYYYEKSKILSQNLKDSLTYAASLIQLGMTYRYIDQVKFAEYSMLAQKAAKKSGDPYTIIQANRLLAMLYRSQNELDKALEVYNKILISAKHSNDSLEISWTYNDIGIIYMMKAKYEQGLEFWKKSLALKLKLGDLDGASATMSNIGLYYKDINKLEDAKKYILESLNLNLESGNLESAAFNLSNLGALYTKTEEYDKGEEAFLRSLKYSDSLNNYFDKKETLLGLYQLYKKKGDLQKALQTHEQFVQVLEKEFDRNNTEITKELTTKFETEKKEKELEVISAENKLIQTNFRYALISGVLLLVGLVVIIFILRKVRKAKKQVEIQRQLIQNKNDEIIDSIKYAKRLQNAILPKQEAFDKLPGEVFIYYRPKDIVAGDFYWFEQHGENLYFAVADCTGHGVPGAMVSVVCSNALTKVVTEDHESIPSAILDKTRAIIVEQYQKSGENVKDGMDISLAVLNINSRKLQWAGAHNPLWIFRKNDFSERITESLYGSNNDLLLIEIKGDKQPVGNFDHAAPFSNHHIQLMHNDHVYMFTDGFPDQFGGKAGKKYKSGNFKKFLSQLTELNISAQPEAIEKEFLAWKGANDQVDDICILGWKVDEI